MKQFFKNKLAVAVASIAALVMIGTVAHAALVPVSDRQVIFGASASVNGSSVTISVSSGTLSMTGLTDPECFEKTPPQPPPYPTHNGWYSPIATQTSPTNTAQITSGVLSGQTIPLTVSAGNEGSNCWDDVGSAATFSGSRTFTGVAAGSHTVNVRVTDNLGRLANRSVSFTVAGTPTCSPSQASVYQNESVTFTGANGSGYTWQFTGGTGTASNPSGSGNTYATSFSNTGTKTVTVTSGGQSSTCTVNVQAAPATPTCSPSSQTASVGQPVTLSATGGSSGNYTWTTTGSSSATPSGTNNSSLSVTYGSAGTYNVTVTRSGVTSTVCVVNVQSAPGQPPTLTLTGPASVPLNTAPTLTWIVNDAQVCTDEPDRWYWVGPFTSSDGTHTSSSGSIAPHTVAGQSRNYRMKCSNAFGDVFAEVTVGTDAAPVSPIGVTLSASPSSGPSPLQTTLTWTTSGNPTSCDASLGWTGSKNVAGGSQQISGVTQNTTYLITCSKSGVPDAIAEVSVGITGAGLPPFVTITPNPSSGTAPLTTNLNYQTGLTAGQTGSCTATSQPTHSQWSGNSYTPAANPHINKLGGNKTISNINQTTTFSLECSNEFGSSSDSKTVTINPVQTGTIVVVSNEPTTWTVSGAGGPYTTIGNQTSVQYNNVPTGSYTIAPVTPAGYVFDPAESSVFSQVVTAGNTTTFILNYDLEPVPGASVDISADPTTVGTGSFSLLSWTSDGIESGTCEASGGWSGGQSDTGDDVSTGALTANTTFTITCRVAGSKSETVQDSVTVTVSNDPPGGGDPECSDGIDNFDPEDTLADAADPDCYDEDDNYDPTDNNETNIPVPGDDDDDPITPCNDGFDNDGDGNIDYPEDEGCSSPTDTTEQATPDIREI